MDNDDIDKAVAAEAIKLDSPVEDNDFLDQIDKGYIGLGPVQVRFTPDPYQGVPTWVIRKFEFMARQEGLELEQFLDKYQPSFDPADWDNDPGSPEQAYA